MSALRPWYTPETCPYDVTPHDLPGQLALPGCVPEPPAHLPTASEFTWRDGYVSPQIRLALFDDPNAER